jgi:hypothetical protein
MYQFLDHKPLLTHQFDYNAAMHMKSGTNREQNLTALNKSYMEHTSPLLQKNYKYGDNLKV